jgi:mannosylfructose-phosphate synthase
MADSDLEIARDVTGEIGRLFAQHQIPEPGADDTASGCRRIAMVSTHGHWGDPPPAGATDTGGQTLYVLQISKEWARAGRQVLILARWFAPFARVDALEPGLWLVRIPAGSDRFVRKEDIYPLAPVLAEYATAVVARFGAQAIMGHYADGMVVAAEVAARRGLPLVAMPHSVALTKIDGLGLARNEIATWFDERYHFAAREEYELAALAQADYAIGCLPEQLEALSHAYHLRTPREVVLPGVAPIFFAAGAGPSDPDIPARFGLVPGRFVIVTGRLAETKNIPGVVALLGEARALAPARLAGVALAVVGGNAAPSEPEEFAVQAAIEAAMARHGLDRRDVVRISSQHWTVVSQLLRQALFYAGMQHFEPFGMGAAEALAVGTPVLLSRRAGISRMLEGEPPCAVLVDPANPREAARQLIAVLENPSELARMTAAGRVLARAAFSWPASAAKLAALLDRLVVGAATGPPMRRRPRRGQHRLASSWRGDQPRIKSQHAWSAEQLIPWILDAQHAALRADQRLIVAIGGESGTGKTEIAHCLAIALRRHHLWSALVPGDVFFRLPPAANHEARLAAARAGRLADYLGPPREIDLDALDDALAEATDPSTRAILCPSDCRALAGRRYPRIPLDLTSAQVVLVDLTYAMLLDAPTLRIFLESDHLARREALERRHATRDPDQDFAFILSVLAIEHAQIAPTAARAHLRVDVHGVVHCADQVAITRAAAGAQD